MIYYYDVSNFFQSVMSAEIQFYSHWVRLQFTTVF